MATKLGKAVKTLQASYRTLATLPLAKLRAARPLDDRIVYVKPIGGERWKALGKAATSRAKSYAKTTRALLAQRAKIRQQWQTNARVGKTIAKQFTPPNRLRDWRKRMDAVRAELKKRGMKAPQIDRALARLTALRGDKIVRHHVNTIENLSEHFDRLAERSVAGRMGAEIAARIADFNRSYRKPSGTTRGVAKFVSSTTKRVVAIERDYYRSLKGGRTPALSTLNEPGLKTWLNDAVRHAAAVAAARTADRANPALGKLALDVGKLLRRLLRHLALRETLRWIAADASAAPAQREWQKAAAGLAFDKPAKAPREVSIAKLVRNPRSVRSGATIAVTGLVGPVTITHKAGSANSKASLSDADGHGIRIATKHRKMDSAGMVGGAYAAVVGEWAPARSGGTLHLIRTRYTDRAATSWTDWVTKRLRPVYEASPQGLATEWSWEPGADGAGNQLRYGLWSVNNNVLSAKEGD